MTRDLGSHCAAAHFAGAAPMFALLDGTVHCWDAERSVHAHPALLAVVPSADQALLTGGEDGRVCRIDASGESFEVARVPRKWIDCVAEGGTQTVAFATGRSVWVQGSDGVRRELQHEQSIADLQFEPDGSRLAVARFGGVRFHALAEGASPLELEWRGMFAGLTFSPDGRFLLAFMKDGLMHGWRLPGREVSLRHFRMTGYGARIPSWSWSDDGRWLATAGAASGVVWSFAGEHGPIGTVAREIGEARGEASATVVAFRPGTEELALGYSDGAIVVASLDGGAESLAGIGRGAVRAMAWDPDGARLAFGTETGECGVIRLSG